MHGNRALALVPFLVFMQTAPDFDSPYETRYRDMVQKISLEPAD